MKQSTRIYRRIDKAPVKLPCSRCKKNKLANEENFRIRTYGTGHYYNSNCIKCDNEIAAEYYAKMKDDPEFRKKNRDRVREYANKNIDQIKERRKTTEYRKKKLGWEKGRYQRKRDEINARQRLKRKSPHYKKAMKAYRARNKEKIYQQEVITKKRYHEKNKNAVTDKYCTNLLRTQGILNPTLEQIEIKRSEILIYRLKESVRKIKKR